MPPSGFNRRAQDIVSSLVVHTARNSASTLPVPAGRGRYQAPILRPGPGGAGRAKRPESRAGVLLLFVDLGSLGIAGDTGAAGSAAGCRSRFVFLGIGLRSLPSPPDFPASSSHCPRSALKLAHPVAYLLILRNHLVGASFKIRRWFGTCASPERQRATLDNSSTRRSRMRTAT